MVNVFTYLLIFNVFAGAFVVVTPLPFEFCIGYIFVIAFLVFYILRYRNAAINSTFLVILLVLTIISIVNVYFGRTASFRIAKQFLGILVTGTAYYLLLKINNFEIDKLFKIYLRIALIVAAIGIFQELSFLAGFEPGYNYWSLIMRKWDETGSPGGLLRVNSIFTEPAHFAITMAPACFVSLMAIIKNKTFYLSKKAGIVMIIPYILTLSLVAYAAILISSLLMFFSSGGKKFRHVLLIAIMLPILSYSIYRYVPDIRMRVDSAIGAATGSIKTAEIHQSVYALTSNAFVAYKSFTDSPLFGRGLGSHPISYKEFIPPGTYITLVNKEDAGSLFLRLVSETGLFGVIAVLYFVFKFRLKIDANKTLPIMSNAIFVLFIMQLLRQGHYFVNGLFFFVWLYYFAYRIYSNAY